MPIAVRNNFSSGILSPQMAYRTDLERYSSGLAECENFIIKGTGGVEFRAGFQLCERLTEQEASQANLIPYVLDPLRAFILVFVDKKMYVVRNGKFETFNGTKVSVATAFDGAELHDLDYSQSGEDMTLVHPNKGVYRVFAKPNGGEIEWKIEVASYNPDIQPPTLDSLTAVGDGAGTYSKEYKYAVTSMAAGVESVASNVEAITTPTLSSTAGVKLEWTAPAEGTVEFYRVYKEADPFSGSFGWIGDSKSLSFVDNNVAANTAAAPPEESIPPDKPRAVTFYQQRQLFGAPSADDQQSIVSSQTGNAWNFYQSRPLRETDAFKITAYTPHHNTIQYFIQVDTLVALTTGAEIALTEGVTEVFTPFSVGVRVLSNFGCARVKPVVVGETAVYVQDKGSRIREISQGEDRTRVQGTDLAVMVRHLFQGKEVVQMAYSRDPDGILWVVLDDGSLLSLTYHSADGIYAWATHTLGGTRPKVTSVAVVPEGPEDVAYITVTRENDLGESVSSIERLIQVETDTVDPFYGIDSWLRQPAKDSPWTSPVTTVGGLGHLKNTKVRVIVDGMTLPDTATVDSNGDLLLPYPAEEYVAVGVPFSGHVETLPISDTNNLPRTRLKGVPSVSAYVYLSRGMWAGVVPVEGEPEMFEARPRGVSDGYDSPAPYTGQIDITTFGGWSPEAKVRIEQREPFPLNIMALEYVVDA